MQAHSAAALLGLLLPLVAAPLVAGPQAPPPAPHAGPGQEPGQEPGGDEAAAGDEPDEPASVTVSKRLRPEADALFMQFQSDLVDYNVEAREARSKGLTGDLLPRHPAKDYWPRFAELAALGSGDALAWMIEVFHPVFDAPEERQREGRELFTRLFERFPNERYTVAAADVMPRHSETLGLEWCFERLEELGTRSTDPEVQARALDVQARLLLQHATRTGERIPGEVRRIWQMVVDGYPETNTARMCASKLYRRTEVEFREALAEWMGRLEEIHAAGGGVEDWPPAPLHEFILVYRPLANSGYLEAIGWVERLYQEFLNAEARGPVAGLRYLADVLSVRYMYSADAWMNLKFRMMRFLFEEFPDDPALVDMVEGFQRDAEHFSAARLVPIFQPLAENATQPEVRVHALFFLAQTYAKGTTHADLQEALALYALIVEEFPKHFLAARSKVAQARMRRTMPGALAPDFRTTDQHGLEFELSDYRGRVVLLSVGGFWCEPWVLELEREVRLAEMYADEPFSIIAVSTDNTDKRSIAEQADENGMTWRVTLQRHKLGPLLIDWNIEAFPTWIVIGPDGVIRTRNAAWAETERVIEELLAGLRPAGTPSPRDAWLAAYRAAPEAGALGRVEGRAVLRGEPRPKRPLVPKQDVAAGCCPEGEELDTKDRSLIVGESQGLANVVVSVKLPGLDPPVRAEPVMLALRRCRLEPHVLVVPVGATVRVVNDDHVAHVLETEAVYAPSVDLELEPGAAAELVFERRQRVRVTSPERPWMESWIYVTDTPFTAITDETGRFALEGVPPGEHVLLYWHENKDEVGTGRRVVEVKEGETADVRIRHRTTGRRGRATFIEGRGPAGKDGGEGKDEDR